MNIRSMFQWHNENVGVLKSLCLPSGHQQRRWGSARCFSFERSRSIWSTLESITGRIHRNPIEPLHLQTLRIIFVFNNGRDLWESVHCRVLKAHFAYKNSFVCVRQHDPCSDSVTDRAESLTQVRLPATPDFFILPTSPNHRWSAEWGNLPTSELGRSCNASDKMWSELFGECCHPAVYQIIFGFD
jgi:hypothetical protein